MTSASAGPSSRLPHRCAEPDNPQVVGLPAQRYDADVIRAALSVLPTAAADDDRDAGLAFAVDVT